MEVLLPRHCHQLGSRKCIKNSYRSGHFLTLTHPRTFKISVPKSLLASLPFIVNLFPFGLPSLTTQKVLPSTRGCREPWRPVQAPVPGCTVSTAAWRCPAPPAVDGAGCPGPGHVRLGAQLLRRRAAASTRGALSTSSSVLSCSRTLAGHKRTWASPTHVRKPACPLAPSVKEQPSSEPWRR